jgi:hypothetical protein
LIRLTDPERVNSLVGIDLGLAPHEPSNFFLEEDGSLGCFLWRGPGIYEIHLAFKVGGREALDLFARMKAQVPAKLFWAAVPVESRHVRMFARLAGFRSEGVTGFADGYKEIFVSEG